MSVADAGLLRVAHCLALDALAVRAITALDVHGIDAMVLKGPATVHWIYADIPGRRNYSDLDLLVEPAQWQAAVEALCELGMTDVLAGIRPSEAAQLYERPLRAGAGLRIDLHRGFFGVGHPDAFWEQLSTRQVRIPIGGAPLAIPDKACAALIYALHAAQNGGARATVGKPQHDLERALDLFDEAIWEAAHDLARQAGAEAGFVTGLYLADKGRPIIDRLELGAVGDPMVWLRAATAVRRGDVRFGQIWNEPNWRSRLIAIRDAIAPSPTVVLRARPGAGRGRLPLPRAYVKRWLWLPVAVPRAALRWRLAQRSAGRPGLEPSRRRRIPRAVWVVHAAARLAAGGDRTRAGTLGWTLRALRAARTQLRALPPPLVVIPAPRPERVGAPAVMRGRAGAVRLVLKALKATCLEECVVRQRWLAAAGVPSELVVGVTSPSSGFRAHAWLAGDRVPDDFVELTRYPAG